MVVERVEMEAGKLVDGRPRCWRFVIVVCSSHAYFVLVLFYLAGLGLFWRAQKEWSFCFFWNDWLWPHNFPWRQRRPQTGKDPIGITLRKDLIFNPSWTILGRNKWIGCSDEEFGEAEYYCNGVFAAAATNNISWSTFNLTDILFRHQPTLPLKRRKEKAVP